MVDIQVKWLAAPKHATHGGRLLTARAIPDESPTSRCFLIPASGRSPQSALVLALVAAVLAFAVRVRPARLAHEDLG